MYICKNWKKKTTFKLCVRSFVSLAVI